MKQRIRMGYAGCSEPHSQLNNMQQHSHPCWHVQCSARDNMVPDTSWHKKPHTTVVGFCTRYNKTGTQQPSSGNAKAKTIILPSERNLFHRKRMRNGKVTAQRPLPVQHTGQPVHRTTGTRTCQTTGMDNHYRHQAGDANTMNQTMQSKWDT